METGSGVASLGQGLIALGALRGPGRGMAQVWLQGTARISGTLGILTTHTSVLDTIFCAKLQPVIAALPFGPWYYGQYLQQLYLHIAQMGRNSPQETNAFDYMFRPILDLL